MEYCHLFLFLTNKVEVTYSNSEIIPSSKQNNYLHRWAESSIDVDGIIIFLP